MADKRIVIISDLHCGHEVGLTPPRWDPAVGKVYLDRTKIEKFSKIREQCWNFYATTIAKLQPIYALIVNGDCIDGRGDKSGGTEEFELNRDRQCSMAMECIQLAKAKQIHMTYGTPYHTGDKEDWENIIAERIGAQIGAETTINVNGLLFNFKHHVGSSGVPTGRFNSIARDGLWNDLWSLKKGVEPVDIIVRSHTHYHVYCGYDGRLGIITPALQGMGSKFGSRRCSGTVDFGLIHFDVNKKGEYTWASHLANISHQITKPIKV
jgi:hypothetical protein